MNCNCKCKQCHSDNCPTVRPYSSIIGLDVRKGIKPFSRKEGLGLILIFSICIVLLIIGAII